MSAPKQPPLSAPVKSFVQRLREKANDEASPEISWQPGGDGIMVTDRSKVEKTFTRIMHHWGFRKGISPRTKQMTPNQSITKDFEYWYHEKNLFTKENEQNDVQLQSQMWQRRKQKGAPGSATPSPQYVFAEAEESSATTPNLQQHDAPGTKPSDITTKTDALSSESERSSSQTCRSPSSLNTDRSDACATNTRDPETQETRGGDEANGFGASSYCSVMDPNSCSRCYHSASTSFENLFQADMSPPRSDESLSPNLDSTDVDDIETRSQNRQGKQLSSWTVADDDPNSKGFKRQRTCPHQVDSLRLGASNLDFLSGTTEDADGIDDFSCRSMEDVFPAPLWALGRGPMFDGSDDDVDVLISSIRNDAAYIPPAASLLLSPLPCVQAAQQHLWNVVRSFLRDHSLDFRDSNDRSTRNEQTVNITVTGMTNAVEDLDYLLRISRFDSSSLSARADSGNGDTTRACIHTLVWHELERNVPLIETNNSNNANLEHKFWLKKKLQDLLSAHFAEELSIARAIEALSHQLEGLQKISTGRLRRRRQQGQQYGHHRGDDGDDDGDDNSKGESHGNGRKGDHRYDGGDNDNVEEDGGGGDEGGSFGEGFGKDVSGLRDAGGFRDTCGFRDVHSVGDVTTIREFGTNPSNLLEACVHPHSVKYRTVRSMGREPLRHSEKSGHFALSAPSCLPSLPLGVAQTMPTLKETEENSERGNDDDDDDSKNDVTKEHNNVSMKDDGSFGIIENRFTGEIGDHEADETVEAAYGDAPTDADDDDDSYYEENDCLKDNDTATTTTMTTGTTTTRTTESSGARENTKDEKEDELVHRGFAALSLEEVTVPTAESTDSSGDRFSSSTWSASTSRITTPNDAVDMRFSRVNPVSLFRKTITKAQRLVAGPTVGHHQESQGQDSTLNRVNPIFCGSQDVLLDCAVQSLQDWEHLKREALQQGDFEDLVTDRHWRKLEYASDSSRTAFNGVVDPLRKIQAARVLILASYEYVFWTETATRERQTSSRLDADFSAEEHNQAFTRAKKEAKRLLWRQMEETNFPELASAAREELGLRATVENTAEGGSTPSNRRTLLAAFCDLNSIVFCLRPFGIVTPDPPKDFDLLKDAAIHCFRKDLSVPLAHFLTEPKYRKTLRVEKKSASVSCCAILADRKRALIGRSDGDLRLIDLSKSDSSCTIFSFQHEKAISCCVPFRGDTRMVSTSHDETLKVWTLERGGNALQTLRGHAAPVSCCVVYHNEERILSCCLDGVLIIWEWSENSFKVRAVLGAQRSGTPIYCCVVYCNGTKAMCGGDHFVRMWDLEEEAEKVSSTQAQHGCGVPRKVQSIVLDEKQKLAIGAESNGDIWKLDLVDFSLPSRQSSPASTTAEDAGVAISFSAPPTVQVLPQMSRRQDNVSCCAVSPDDACWILSVSLDGTLVIRDLELGNPLYAGYISKKEGITCCAAISNTLVLLGHDSGDVNILELPVQSPSSVFHIEAEKALNRAAGTISKKMEAWRENN